MKKWILKWLGIDEELKRLEILNMPIVDLDNPENNCPKCGTVHCH